MEISDFAHRILFSNQLSEKLHSPTHLSDTNPGQALKHIPLAPHRAQEFQLITSRQHKRPKKELRPNLEQLQDHHFRGRILHTFAHHELISLELMALALLRFPEAPRAFRRGLAKVMIDEQRHFKLYQERVIALGLDLGEEPVSDYFWRCVAHAPNLASFNARLALVFEQANIDFTRHYGPLFEQLGDLKSAIALDQIYQDEISHVGFGLHWFRTWRPNNEPEWDSFCQLLEPPLSAGRAKGAVFSIAGRQAAGFSEEFIEQLRLWGGSTGRPPLVWFGHFDFEEALQDRAQEQKLLPDDRSPKRRSKRKKLRTLTQESFTPLLAWLCTRGDLICSPKEVPSQAFQSLIQKARGLNPEWCLDYRELRERKLGGLRPWGWSTQCQPILELLQASLLTTGEPPPNLDTIEKLYLMASKLEVPKLRSELQKELNQAGEECPLYFPSQAATLFWNGESSIESLLAELQKRSHHHSQTWLCKRAYGSAGRGIKKLLLKEGLDQPTIGWLKRSCPLGITIEPYVNRVCDLSFHAWIEHGQIRYDGEVVGLVNEQGQFQGAYLGSPSSVLPQELKRFLNGEGRDRKRLSRVGKLVTKVIGSSLMKTGYNGPFGVDALILKTVEDSFQLYPLVELNPRFTMGRLALHLRKIFDPKGLLGTYFEIYPHRNAVSESDMNKAYQVMNDHNWDQQGRWCGEVLPLSDIWSSEHGLEQALVLLKRPSSSLL